MIGFVIGRGFKSINCLLHYRSWWFGKWTKFKLKMGPPDVFWSPEVEVDILAQLGQEVDV